MLVARQDRRLGSFERAGSGTHDWIVKESNIDKHVTGADGCAGDTYFSPTSVLAGFVVLLETIPVATAGLHGRTR